MNTVSYDPGPGRVSTAPFSIGAKVYLEILVALQFLEELTTRGTEPTWRRNETTRVCLIAAYQENQLNIMSGEEMTG